MCLLEDRGSFAFFYSRPLKEENTELRYFGLFLTNDKSIELGKLHSSNGFFSFYFFSSSCFALYESHLDVMFWKISHYSHFINLCFQNFHFVWTGMQDRVFQRYFCSASIAPVTFFTQITFCFLLKMHFKAVTSLKMSIFFPSGWDCGLK